MNKDGIITSSPPPGVDKRHEARYQRRKAKREQRRRERSEALGPAEEIFSFEDLYKAGKECCNGVRWKASTTNFERNLITQTAETRWKVLHECYEPRKYNSFQLNERGTLRDIDAPHIIDRQLQKLLAKNVLLPLYSSAMIYNNGASMKGKGLGFSLSMLKKELVAHFHKYGRGGWIIILDFSRFFPNASHRVLKERHAKYVYDDITRNLLDKMVDSFPHNIGAPIGLEMSQIEMVTYMEKLDNFLKCQKGLKGVGHYMDDYYVLVPPDMSPWDLLNEILKVTDELELIVNVNKTKIAPLGVPFKYCKVKYRLETSGKVLMSRGGASVRKARRKMLKFAEGYIKGEISIVEIYDTLQSSFAYYEKYNNHTRLLKLRRMFYSMFGFTFGEAKERAKGERGKCNTLYIEDSKENASEDM